MVLSSMSVVLNALRLRLYKLPYHGPGCSAIAETAPSVTRSLARTYYGE